MVAQEGKARKENCVGQALQTTDHEFSLWLETQGYLDPQGILTITLREARAVYCMENIQRHMERIEQSYIALSRELWLIYKHQLWIELGYNNFVELLYSPDINVRKSWGYASKDIGMLLEEGVITEDEIRGIDPSKMRALLPLLKDSNEDEESRAEWLAKAQTLTTLDLEDELRGHEIHRYHGVGLLEDLLRELSDEPAFWESQVALSIKTC